MTNYNNLFSPIKIGGLEIRNRGVMPSMVTNYCNEDGSVTDRFVSYHGARAEGGVGMIIVEAAYVDKRGKGFTNQIGIDNDQLIPGLKRLTDEIHRHGAKAAIQIYHGGRQANTMVTCEPLVAPSAIPCPVMQAMPKELNADEIKQLVESFADAAERVRKAGFDAVEIHGAHGYLLNQFLSPNSNHRTDEYGGSVENRMRFPLEVVQAVRNRVGNDYPIIYRITTDEFLPDGLTLDDTVAFSKVLVDQGVDAINVSGSTYVAGRTSSGPDDVLGVYVENAAAIKKSIDSAIPVIVANRIKRPEFADEVIETGKADMVATGRGLICDPEFYNKTKRGDVEDIRICLSCNHCVNELMKGVPISCIYNPLTGNEAVYDMSMPAETKKKVVVIGGGPAGMEAAVIAAGKGHDVTLFEQGAQLGGNVIPGTKPPFKSEMMEVVRYLTHMLDKNKVMIKLNTKADVETIQSLNPDVVILASGSSPIIPRVPGVDQPFVVLAEEALQGKTLGQKIVVIGGGSVGVETAEFLEEKGKTVIIVEMAEEILADLEPVMKGSLLYRIGSSTIRVLTGQKVEKIKEGEVITEQESLKDIDNVVLAVGYKPNMVLADQLKSNSIPFTVIGDALQPRKIYQAVKEGFEAAYSI